MNNEHYYDERLREIRDHFENTDKMVNENFRFILNEVKKLDQRTTQGFNSFGEDLEFCRRAISKLDEEVAARISKIEHYYDQRLKKLDEEMQNKFSAFNLSFNRRLEKLEQRIPEPVFLGMYPAVEDVDHEQLNKQVEAVQKGEPQHAYHTPVGPSDGEFFKLNREIERLNKELSQREVIYQGARNEGKSLAWAMTEISTCIFGSPCNMPSPEAVVHHVKALKEACQEYLKYKTMWEGLENHLEKENFFSTNRCQFARLIKEIEQLHGISSSSQEKPLRKLGEPLN